MAKMVQAWNKRTGEALPNPVPKEWLDKGLFPNLAASASAASRAEDTTTRSGKAAGKTKEA